jgi:hypothetical protein
MAPINAPGRETMRKPVTHRAAQLVAAVAAPRPLPHAQVLPTPASVTR